MSIAAKSLKKSFGTPEHIVLHDLDFEIAQGEFVSIWGRSGSGKTTLLYLLSTLDTPTAGQVLYDNRDVGKMSLEELHQFRNEQIGFIFQFHYLLPELSSAENVLLPIRKKGRPSTIDLDRAQELLGLFGLSEKKDRLPSQLSGGEQQRVAIARALMMKPKYIFADEPTGNLDTANGEIVMQLLKRANKEWGTTVVLVTHEQDYAKMADRQIVLVDGHLA